MAAAVDIAVEVVGLMETEVVVDTERAVVVEIAVDSWVLVVVMVETVKEVSVDVTVPVTVDSWVVVAVAVEVLIDVLV